MTKVLKVRAFVLQAVEKARPNRTGLTFLLVLSGNDPLCRKLCDRG